MSVALLYSAMCDELYIPLNPYILEVLTDTATTDVKLTGNDRLKRVQKLSDDDVLVLSCCFLNTGTTGLDLRYNDISDVGARHLADLIQEVTSTLRFVDLMGNNILADGAETVAKSLHNNQCILSVRLTGNKIGNRGGMCFASMLQINHTLQELDLADCDLGTQCVIAFAIVLKSNTSLLSLNISRPILFSRQDETAVHLSAMLRLNQTLRELHLGKMAFTDSGMERLAEGLRANQSLRYLDLRCNQLSCDGAQTLSGVLKSNSALQILDLSSNRIKDEGAASLSEAIESPACGLKALSVTSNNIESPGLLALAQAMKASSTLTHVYIWGNRLHEPVCQAFSELMACGRLAPGHTDVSPYEVDGRVSLAEVFHGLRRHYYWTPSDGADGGPSTNAALALTALTP
ncbi:leucine-rich repeat-containing protein 34 [Gadus macrocephalus]|uniref:leucine-rich repeat-containing protein 34 n=1 Tax=Gadus macrocephalus TaxID=80720 RepID=UPI0028CBBACA|nr:leucine-rich repeat-containing protein 34 [Gadus macrocephalus]